jgi:hypothetical protein
MQIRCFSIIVFLFGASASLMAGTISILPASPTETAGQNFMLSVQISGATDLYGYQFDIGFNPAILQAVSATEGPFLPTGGPTIFLPGTIDNVGGSITANADILNGAVSGVNGSGDLLDVTFKALTGGSTSVQIFNLFALNSFGQGMTETTIGSTVTVLSASVPEPRTGLLLMAGVAGLIAFRKFVVF